MTPLQEAAKAAKDKLKLAVCARCRFCPSCSGSGVRGCGCKCECPECYGTGTLHVEVADADGYVEREPIAPGYVNPNCRACGGSGVGTSNPHEVLGRAFGWLLTNHRHPVVWQTRASALVLSTRIEEPHDGTVEGVAAALLRLVARCDGPGDEGGRA